jgi:hypothetical protein
MEQQIDRYYWYHLIASTSVLLLVLVYNYPIVLFLLATGILGYFYVKSQEPIVEQFYQSLVDNTVTRSPSQASQE